MFKGRVLYLIEREIERRKDSKILSEIQRLSDEKLIEMRDGLRAEINDNWVENIIIQEVKNEN